MMTGAELELCEAEGLTQLNTQTDIDRNQGSEHNKRVQKIPSEQTHTLREEPEPYRISTRS